MEVLFYKLFAVNAPLYVYTCMYTYIHLYCVPDVENPIHISHKNIYFTYKYTYTHYIQCFLEGSQLSTQFLRCGI